MFTWSDAWHNCVDDAIKNLGVVDVIVKIESLNEIVTDKVEFKEVNTNE